VGYWKNRMLEEEGRGWRSRDKYVCAAHVEDDELLKVVEANLVSTSCSYCDRQGTDPIAAELDVVTERVAVSLRSEWEDPNSAGVPWDEGWVEIEAVYTSTWDLLDNLEDGNPFNSSELLADLNEAFMGQQWTTRHFFSLSPDERWAYGWDRFSEVVKHQSRFFFMQEPDDEDDPEFMTPAEVLEAVGTMVEELGLFRMLSAGSCVYRGRAEPSGKSYDSAKLLGPPLPEQVTGSNRMSPAGIAHCYVALDTETALAEASAASPKGPARVAIGQFGLARDMRVIDLASALDVPSLFSEERERRPFVAFLRRFQAAIARATPRDGREHIEYVPSQVVTEWFRTVFRPGDGGTIDGLAYPSIQASGGVNVALFVGQRDVADQPEPGLAMVYEGREVRQRPSGP
jgi:hypothetical protein